MKKYHITPYDGVPRLCTAEIECKYGFSEHYENVTEAWISSEQRNEMRVRAQKFFTDKSLEAYQEAELVGDDYRVQHGIVKNITKRSVRAFMLQFTGALLSKVEGRKFSEEQMEIFFRNAVPKIEHDINSREFWNELHDRMTEESFGYGKESDGSVSKKLPKAFVLSTSSKQIGSKETADKLMDLMKNFDDGSHIEDEYNDNDSVRNKFNNAGFSLLSSGFETVVFSETGTNNVWKVSRGEFSDTEASKLYVTNTIAGYQNIPRSDSLKVAEMSGYFKDGLTVIAQEKIAFKGAGSLEPISKNDYFKLSLIGHDDTSGNYSTVDGVTTIFDTHGTVYDDALNFDFKNMEKF